MFTTVTLNPCIDKTVTVPSLETAQLNRISKVDIVYAGKGFNVAKTIARLGKNATATGFIYTGEEHAVVKSLEKEGIKVDCVVCPGHLRINTKIFDEKRKKVTELNEDGVETSDEYINKLIEKIEHYAESSKFVVLSGSLPPKCPADIYSRIIEKVKPKCKVVLDTSGDALKEGIKAKPTIIKPNKDELVGLIGKNIDNLTDALDAANQLVNQGIEIVCVSLGREGAMITNGKKSYYSPVVPNTVVKGTVCAGDSLVGALIVGLDEGLSLKEAFRKSIASATSCVMQEGSEVASKALLDEVIHKVEVQSI